jgi:hypothetical protein
VRRRILGPVLVAFVLGGSLPATAATTQLMPGVSYETGVQFTPHGPVALHIVRGPRPGGLYRLRPVLSNETVTGRETVSSMQRRLAPQGTTVGVNGDYFSFAKGSPSGILLRDSVLVSAPNGHRSSAGITLDGDLDVRRVRLYGTWRGLGQQRTLNAFNEAPGRNGIALFTSDWGPATPRIQGALTMILSPFPAATPNVDLSARVSDLLQDGSMAIAPGTAALVARGTAAEKLAAEAPLGTTITIRLIFQPGWETVSDAIGGGPVLVKDGRPVFRANEWFTTAQLVPRSPRTAVGQLADGRILLVAVDGRQSGYSVGMTNFEMAQALVRLGAVEAMGLDGGGSTTLAFDGTVLNRPSDGRERPVATALMLLYSGVYAPPPALSVQSPNGDGVAEEQALRFKIVRPSTVTVTLTAPDGTVDFQETGLREPGMFQVPFPPVPSPPPPTPEGEPPPAIEPLLPAEGRWTLTVNATDDGGVASTMTRRFWVNSTLGYLRVAPRTMVLRRTGGRAAISWKQARAARVTVTVETAAGFVLRRIANRSFEPGENAVTWDGMRSDRKLAYGGVYRVRVVARNEVGLVSLAGQLRVRRLAPV